MALGKKNPRMSTGACAYAGSRRNTRSRRSSRRVPESNPSQPVEFEPEGILDHRVLDNNLLEVRVLWKGYSVDEATWEPASALVACTDVLEEYYGSRVDFEPQHILGHRWVHIVCTDENRLELLVQWKGFRFPTWEPAAALAACTDVQLDYYAENEHAPMSIEFRQYLNERYM
jgi:hypothetical protein